MVLATAADKHICVEILTESFYDNLSVAYLIPESKNKRRKVAALMDYSFEQCLRFGEVWLNDDKTACALAMLPEKKHSTLLLDLMLIFKALGLANLFKAMRREKLIHAKHPNGNVYYLWFIGVAIKNQAKGCGTLLLRHLIDRAKTLNKTVLLETSTRRNLGWYEKNGFREYDKLDLGYELYFFEGINN
ncbi:MAG: GNAT family N-acetyltransferase [Chitinophagaceae bacterium]